MFHVNELGAMLLSSAAASEFWSFFSGKQAKSGEKSRGIRFSPTAAGGAVALKKRRKDELFRLECYKLIN
jgi:hypothetical protein